MNNVRRACALVVLGLACAAAGAANPAPRAEGALEIRNLSSIAGWLREHGREGYLGADVADAMGIARSEGEMLAARQRGYRSDDVLRIAQVLDDGVMLFMVQRPDDQVYFYLSTPLGGLQKALLSIPSRNLVVPLSRGEAELRFQHEVLYWKDRSIAP